MKYRTIGGRVALFAGLYLAAPAVAQTLETVLPAGPGTLSSGYSTFLLEDVDADGTRDFAVAYPQDPSASLLAELRMFSGSDRSLLHAIPNVAQPIFGIATIGDWDGDGQGDLVLVTDNGTPAVTIHSATSGAVLTELPTPSLLPAGIEGVGDLDGDGVSDFLVVDPFQRIRVHSGSDGVLMNEISSSSPQNLASLDGSRDFNGDGRRDLVLGSIDPASLYGNLRILTLPAGSELLSLASTPFCDTCGYLGVAAVAIQDLEGDGLSDLVATYSTIGPSGIDYRLAAYSSFSGEQLWETTVGPATGNRIAALGLVNDYDGDGQNDILSSSPQNATSGPSGGRVSVRSSATGEALFSFYGQADHGLFGSRIASLGDLDGDGQEEALVASSGTGIPRIFELASPGGVDCFATINSTGQRAQLDAAGSLDVTDNEFQLVAAPVPEQPGLFFYSDTPVQVPFGNGVRCVGGFISRLEVTLPVAGVLWNSIDLANPPSALGQITPGSTMYFQAWFRDPTSLGNTFNLSDSLQVSFLP